MSKQQVTSRVAIIFSSLLFLLFLFLNFAETRFIHQFRALLDLSGEWEFTTQNNYSRKVHLPSYKLDSEIAPSPGEFLRFEKVFSIKDRCPNNSCYLFAGEIGDVARVTLNGVFLGDHGGFPPAYSYRKNLPLLIQIPSNLLNNIDNKIEILTYSPKSRQVGIRHGPLGIFNQRTGELLYGYLVFRDLITPFLSAALCLLIGCIFLVFGLAPGADIARNKPLAVYCILSFLYLVSFSEIPRYFLDIHWAGLIHFLLRLCYDFGFLVLIISHFKSSSKKRVYGFLFFLYGATAFCFLFGMSMQYFSETTVGFDIAFLIMRNAFPLLLLPPCLAIILFYQKVKNGSATNEELICFASIGATLPMLISDILVFHQLIGGRYFIKYYPIIIAIPWGWMQLSVYFHEKYELLNLRNEISRRISNEDLFKRLAHDIRSPVAAMRTLVYLVPGIDEKTKSLMNSISSRVSEIANNLITKSSKPPMDVELPKYSLLNRLLTDIINEKKVLLSESDIAIETRLIDQSFNIFVECDLLEVGRIMSNILNNSIESFTGTQISKRKIEVSVELNNSSNEIEILISDNGCGIPHSILENIGKKGFSYGKDNISDNSGNGIGLYSAIESLRNWKGRLTINSKNNNGTQVCIYLKTSRY